MRRADAKAATRAKVLEAAGQEFAEVGYAAATVEAIVARAGFTRGAFYANFADKADVFMTLLEAVRLDDLAKARHIVATTPDEAKLDAVLEWYRGVGMGREWELAYAEFWPVAARTPALRERLAARAAANRADIQAMVEGYCVEAGVELPLPSADVAALMLALADGLHGQYHLDPKAVRGDAFTLGITLLWFGIFSSQPPPGAFGLSAAGGS